MKTADLEEILKQHSTPGWDGAEAPPVSPVAMDQARRLILALPPSIPNPELAVDPDDGPHFPGMVCRTIPSVLRQRRHLHPHGLRGN